MLHDFIFDTGVVPVLAIILNFSVDLWVFGENFFHQEFFRQRKCFYIGKSNVYKFCFSVVTQVVVSEERILPKLMRYFIPASF